MVLDVRILGLVPYRDALKLQYSLVEKRQQEEIPDTLLLLEHPPVITLGKRGSEGDILYPEQSLAARGIDIIRVDRGGQVTWHAPGQMIGYFICNLYQHQRKVRRFVEKMEASIIAFLREHWQIQAHADPDDIGVWVNESKIAALGISIHRGVSMHGFALNINTDLQGFSNIIPCGIRDRGVCSVQSLLEAESSVVAGLDMPKLMTAYPQQAKDSFGYRDLVFTSPG